MTESGDRSENEQLRAQAGETARLQARSARLGCWSIMLPIVVPAVVFVVVLIVLVVVLVLT